MRKKNTCWCGQRVNFQGAFVVRFGHSVSEPPHILDSSSSYKPCCGYCLPFAGKAEMPIICFSSLTPFGSLAAGEQTHNLDFRDKCLTVTGEAHPWDHSLLGQWLQKVCVTETAVCCASETTPRSHLCSWVLSSVRDSVLSVCGVIFESLFLYVAPYLALQPFWGFFELPTTIFFFPYSFLFIFHHLWLVSVPCQ